MTANQKQNFKSRMRDFYTELEILRLFHAEVIEAIQHKCRIDSVDTTRTIGGVVKRMNDMKFDFTKPQFEWLRNILRKVCTSEVTLTEATKMLTLSQDELTELMECFDRDELYSVKTHEVTEKASPQE